MSMQVHRSKLAIKKHNFKAMVEDHYVVLLFFFIYFFFFEKSLRMMSDVERSKDSSFAHLRVPKS
jgi:hypothetical protein